MLAAERRMRILEKLQEEKKVVVSELSEAFEVSEETIRRDLDKLEKEGLAVKSYGGATLHESSNGLPYTVRKKRNLAGKEKIAGLIESMISDGDHIILDPSTTALFIVRALKKKEGLTIITNSVEVLLEQPEVSSWEVISTGGYLKEEYLALVGPRAIETLESFNVDKVILSCKGMDMEKGITDSNELFSQIKQKMLRQAKEKILAVDSTKLDKVGFSKICDLTDIDIVVTDIRPSDNWLEFFKEKGIRCYYAEG